MPRESDRRELWIDWLIAHFHGIVLLAMAIALLLVGVVTWQTNQRVAEVEDSIVERLRFQPTTPENHAEPDEPHETGDRRLVYVPAHSHAYGGEGEALLLTVTLTVRNVDLNARIQVHGARYYDTSGTLLKEYVTKPLSLRPLQTVEFLVPESDISGGSGANFIVEWSGSEHVNPPIIEALMIGSSGGLGISFVQRGSEIHGGSANTSKTKPSLTGESGDSP